MTGQRSHRRWMRCLKHVYNFFWLNINTHLNRSMLEYKIYAEEKMTKLVSKIDLKEITVLYTVILWVYFYNVLI